MSNDDLEGRDLARIYLEDLQERVHRHYGLPIQEDLEEIPSEFIQKMLAAGYEESYVQEALKQLKEMRLRVKLSRVSKYETSDWVGLLAMLADDIEGVIKTSGRPITNRPYFGTLRTGRINAMAIKVPDSPSYVVAFEDGLFGFANLMSKIIAQCFPTLTEGKFSTDSKDIERHIGDHPEIADRLIDLLFAYFVNGHPHFSKQYFVDSGTATLAGILRNGMEMFVLAHEYGHVILDHFGPSPIEKAKVGDADVDTLLLNWVQEYEADMFGCWATISVMAGQKFDLYLAYWGIDSFFVCLEIMERALAVLRNDSSDERVSDTHPPIRLRREKILKYVKANAKDEQQKGIESLCMMTDHLTESVWRQCESSLKQMCANKVPLAAGWKDSGH